MATVTGLTAARMLAIEAAAIVDGDVVGDHLVLTRHDGVTIDVGDVRGPEGPAGPVSSDLPVVTALPVLDIGLAGQIRAGRQLTAQDFTDMGLSVPIGLWNLSDATDASGNGRALLNKGAVPFDKGINGLDATAARFSGNVAQALYIADTGALDPFRIRTGSYGCWLKSTKRSGPQSILAKGGVASGNFGWHLFISGTTLFGQWTDGTAVVQAGSSTDVADDRWHFAVLTLDALFVRLYVDGVLEASMPITGGNFASTAPLNIGGLAADAGTNASNPFFGSIDEAFVLSDVLSEEQVYNLYCAKILHTLGTRPTRVTLNVRRGRRGSALAPADFSTTPLRLHNFSAGSLGDEGSNAVPLINPSNALSVAGADGSSNNAFNFNGAQYLRSTDAGLPALLTSRSYGCWFKTRTNNVGMALITWGTFPNNQSQVFVYPGSIGSGSGADSITGPFVADGIWHQVVVVENNTAADGFKRKMYLDGRLVAVSTVLASVTLGGANQFCIGANGTGASSFIGQIDGVFVVNYPLTTDEVIRLYAKAAQFLSPSPKNAGDHVEALNVTNILAAFDSLDGSAMVDLGVAA
jgi:hypothetical protein